MKVKDGAISRKQAVKALIGWDEEAKDEDIIFTLNELPNVVPKKDAEPTIPLSVIEKIHDAIDNADSDGFLANEHDYIIDSTLTKEHIHEIIDKAVKECTHEK